MPLPCMCCTNVNSSVTQVRNDVQSVNSSVSNRQDTLDNMFLALKTSITNLTIVSQPPVQSVALVYSNNSAFVSIPLTVNVTSSQVQCCFRIQATLNVGASGGDTRAVLRVFCEMGVPSMPPLGTLMEIMLALLRRLLQAASEGKRSSSSTFLMWSHKGPTHNMESTYWCLMVPL